MRLLGLNRSVGRRLFAAFGLVCVLLGSVAAAGLWGQHVEDRSRADLAQVQAIRDQLHQLRYLDADVSGWQAYLYIHAGVDGAAKATAPTSGQVQGIMADKAEGSALLANLAKLPLEPAAKSAVNQSITVWNQYFVSTDRMIAELAKGTPAGTAAAYQMLSSGDLDAQWSQLLDQTDAMIKFADVKATALSADAVAEQRTVMVLILVCAGLAVGAAVAA